MYASPVTAVLAQTLTLECVPAQNLAVSLLTNTLSGLTNTTLMENKNHTHSWTETFKEFLPIRVSRLGCL